MTAKLMRDIIMDCCNDVVFTYKQKPSGITSDVKEYTPIFHAWHGSETKDFNNVDDLMSDPFFSGKSINDLIGEIEFTFV